MQIQIEWVRRAIPRSIKPIAKGTNTLVFEDPDPCKVIVFMLCPAKYDWWKECGLITNPDENHIFKHITSKGYYNRSPVVHELTLRRVQAKRLFKAENGSTQKKEITRTVRAMDKIWMGVMHDYPFNMRENVKTHRRIRSAEFWQRVVESDLPTKDLAQFAMDYYVQPDLAPRNALIDANGQIVWSDMFVDDIVLEFVHSRKNNPSGYY